MTESSTEVFQSNLMEHGLEAESMLVLPPCSKNSILCALLGHYT